MSRIVIDNIAANPTPRSMMQVADTNLVELYTWTSQDLSQGSAPSLLGTNITAILAANVTINDSGGIITATEVETALQENRVLINANTTHRIITSGNPHGVRATEISDFDIEVSNNTNVAANTTHRTSTGSDHTWIDQDLTAGSAPSFDGQNISNIDASNVTTGTLPTSVIPVSVITETHVVNSEAEQLALPNVHEGDVAVRTDENKSYIHNGGTASTMADWTELLTPTDAVLSVNGQSGIVELTQDDVGDGASYVQYPITDRTKMNHISVTQAVDLDQMESDISINNTKVTNATHTGDVTGDQSLSITADAVKESHIDWGLDADQVNAALIPITDAGGYFDGVEVESALQELGAETGAADAGQNQEMYSDWLEASYFRQVSWDDFRTINLVDTGNTTMTRYVSGNDMWYTFVAGEVLTSTNLFDNSMNATMLMEVGFYADIDDSGITTFEVTTNGGLHWQTIGNGEVITIDHPGIDIRVKVTAGGGGVFKSYGVVYNPEVFTNDYTMSADSVLIRDDGDLYDATEVETALQEDRVLIDGLGSKIDQSLLTTSTPTFSSLNLSSLPTSSSGLNTGDLFTQTASELGGSGITKVLCVV